MARLTQTTKLDPTEADTQNPLVIERGIKLLNYLVERANQGESVGVGYAQFVCCVHGVESFQEVFNRSYFPSDTAYVLDLAHRITAATGRKRVTKNGVKLEAASKPAWTRSSGNRSLPTGGPRRRSRVRRIRKKIGIRPSRMALDVFSTVPSIPRFSNSHVMTWDETLR